MKQLSTRRYRFSPCAIVSLSLAIGCAKVVTPAGGQGGETGRAGTSGNSGGRGGGQQGVGGETGVSIDAGADAAACQQAQYTFKPLIPTVELAIDRSGSMFHCISDESQVVCPTPSDTSWVKFKDAILPLVASLQSQVRFGFSAIAGSNPANGGTCPFPGEEIPPSLNNSDAIATLYNSLPFPDPATATTSGKKFETPTTLILRGLRDELMADASLGPKYVLLVTDGQSDYCDDTNSLCPPDSVIYVLQSMKSVGITTIVMGIQTTAFDLAPGILEAFANAGAGEPTLAPLPATTGIDKFAFCDQCGSIAGWKADLLEKYPTMTGNCVRGTTLGSYVDPPATAGPTKPYKPNATDNAALVSQLSMAFAGVKTCTFDLSDPSVAATPIKVDITQLNKAEIDFCASITNDVCNSPTKIPLGGTDGWGINCVVPPAGGPCKPTQVELHGQSCADWRMSGNDNIHFNFPCEIIIPG